MKHRLIAAGIAVVMTAINISAVPMPENTSVAARQLPSEGERKAVVEYAVPKGEHWSVAEKRRNDVPYAVDTLPPLRGTSPEGEAEITTPSCATARNDKDLSTDGKDYPSGSCVATSPDKGRQDNAECVEFVATAYCPCAKCCGKYAYNRPVDEDGEPIVYTSTGSRAVQGRTIAVDPSVIPYGTHVLINGVEYVAEDCGGNIKGRRIDVYFADHDEADAFGKQTVTVVQLGVRSE